MTAADLRPQLQLALGSAYVVEREIRLAARLQHPHIVPLLAAGDVAGIQLAIEATAMTTTVFCFRISPSTASLRKMARTRARDANSTPVT